MSPLLLTPVLHPPFGNAKAWPLVSLPHHHPPLPVLFLPGSVEGWQGEASAAAGCHSPSSDQEANRT